MNKMHSPQRPGTICRSYGAGVKSAELEIIKKNGFDIRSYFVTTQVSCHKGTKTPRLYNYSIAFLMGGRLQLMRKLRY